MARPRRPRHNPRVRETPASRYAAAPLEALTGVVLDSDVIIEVLRGRRAVLEAAAALETSGIRTYCTAIQWAEVHAGIRPGEERLTQAFFDARGEVVLDAPTGRHAGAYFAQYARSHGVQLGDALVAAAAATTGLRLWTLNRRHYPMKDIDFYEPERTGGIG